MLGSGDYPFARCLGRINDLPRLRETYRRHDVFVMPSFVETFGVAYIEALSQGTPIVHTRGQGVDGYFQAGTVAEAVDPQDVRSLADAVERLVVRPQASPERCVEQARRFDWSEIAGEYHGLYRAASRPSNRPGEA
jgi:glycosyltransferase involved in cell wall biosynthesis